MAEKLTNYQSDLLYDAEYFSKAAEAALFAFGSAMPFGKLAEAIGTEEKYIPAVLTVLSERYRDSAIELLILDGHAQLATKNEYAEIVRNTLEIRRNQPLSRAALEVLAIIAYNQPATRALVDKVRGVESPSVIMSLCDKGLIEEKGRLDAPGRPMLYGTTPVFLRTFGLESIDDLNLVPELSVFTEQINSQRQQLLLGEEKTEAQKNQLTLEETEEKQLVITENRASENIAEVPENAVSDIHMENSAEPDKAEQSGSPETPDGE
jgi:segregation and condensation protein B